MVNLNDFKRYIYALFFIVGAIGGVIMFFYPAYSTLGAAMFIFGVIMIGFHEAIFSRKRR